MSSSVTVLITSQVKLIVDKLSFLGPIAPIVMSALNLLPYAVIWVVFTFVYVFMPNTKVNFKAGLLAGIIAGTIYQIVQFFYINFQVGVSKYGAIYGSFAALPLFLIWLQVSWLVVLFGAEISFAEQNVETYEFEPDCLKATHSFKRKMAVRIAQHCVKCFMDGQKPLNAGEISHLLELPIRLVRELIFELTEASILSEVKINGRDTVAYQPARNIDQITVLEVINALDSLGKDDIPLVESKEMKAISHSVIAFKKIIEKSPENQLLKNI